MSAVLQRVPWYTLLLVLTHVLLTLGLLHWTAQRLLPHYMPSPAHSHCHDNSNKANASTHCIGADEADRRNAATLATAAYYHIALAALTYLVLSYGLTAPFGRHARETRWGAWPRLMLPARLSWMLQEMPTLLNVVYFVAMEYPQHYATHDKLWSWSLYAQLIVQACWLRCKWSVGLFVVHYLHRTCIYPCFLSSQAMPVPLPVTLSATLYCLINGRLQLLANVRPYSHSVLHDGHRFAATCHTALAALAVAVFAFGMRINTRADYYLLALKRRHAGRYAIPRGGMFAYVSCPNFLGELIEWCGYTLAVWVASDCHSECALAAASFALYTLANLLPRARAHHAWYLARFPDSYAKLGRKALVPYLC